MHRVQRVLEWSPRARRAGMSVNTGKRAHGTVGGRRGAAGNAARSHPSIEGHTASAQFVGPPSERLNDAAPGQALSSTGRCRRVGSGVAFDFLNNHAERGEIDQQQQLCTLTSPKRNAPAVPAERIPTVA